MTTAITHKRWDTFNYVGVLPADVDLAGATARSQIRKTDGSLIDDLDVRFDSDAHTIALRKQNTSHWPDGTAQMDVQFTLANGDIVSTDVVIVRIKQDVTQ